MTPFERPLSPGEQLLVRRAGRTAGLVAAVSVTAAGIGVVVGTALGTAISFVHNALQRRRP